MIFITFWFEVWTQVNFPFQRIIKMLVQEFDERQ